MAVASSARQKYLINRTASLRRRTLLPSAIRRRSLAGMSVRTWTPSRLRGAAATAPILWSTSGRGAYDLIVPDGLRLGRWQASDLKGSRVQKQAAAEEWAMI